MIIIPSPSPGSSPDFSCDSFCQLERGLIRRLHSLTHLFIAVRSADHAAAAASGAHKSAPCTPCLQRDLVLDTCLTANTTGGGDFDSPPRLAHLDCAGSTPRLSRAQNCRRSRMTNDDSNRAGANCSYEVGDGTHGAEPCAGRLHESFSSDITGMNHQSAAVIDAGNARDGALDERGRRRRRLKSHEMQPSTSHRFVTHKNLQLVCDFLCQFDW